MDAMLALVYFAHCSEERAMVLLGLLDVRPGLVTFARRSLTAGWDTASVKGKSDATSSVTDPTGAIDAAMGRLPEEVVRLVEKSDDSEFLHDRIGCSWPETASVWAAA